MLHDVAAVGASTLMRLAATASVAADSLGPAFASASLNKKSTTSDLLAPNPSLSIAASSGPVGSTPISMPVEPNHIPMPVEPTMNSTTPSRESLVIGRGILAITVLPAEAKSAEVVKSPHPIIPTQSPSNDVDMRPVALSLKPKDDDNLPLWLALMIDYLRGVSEDVAWPDLVTEFVDFKKHYPLNGVSLSISFVFFVDTYYSFIKRMFLQI